MPLILVSPYRKIVQAIIDAFSDNVVLLLHMEGADGSTVIVDETQKAVSRFDAVISTARAKFGSSSLNFGANESSNGRVILPKGPDLTFGAGDFCIEMQVFQTQRSSMWGTFLYDGRSIDGAGNAPILFITPSGTLRGGSSDSSLIATSTALVPLNQWNHIAMTRENGVIYLWLNGVQVASIANASNLICDIDPIIGCAANSATSTTLCGNLDEVRITKGRARYTANFAPPTAAFPNPVPTASDSLFSSVSLLMHMEKQNGATVFRNEIGGSNLSAVGVMTLSSAQKKFGDTAAYFDGNSYLTGPLAPASFGFADFTIECFVFPEARNKNFNAIFNNYSVWGAGALGLFAGHGSANTSKYNVSCSGTFPAMQSTSNIQYGAWVHLCLERHNGVFRLYVNGVIEATYNSVVSINGNNGMWIGNCGDELALGAFKGFIDEFRITKAARYKGVNFTIPTDAYPTK